MTPLLLGLLLAAPPTPTAGEHILSLQWLESAGSCTFRAQEDGTLYAEGRHVDAKGNSVELSGQLEDFTPTSFVLVGKIVTQVSYIAGGRACPREGRFTFRAVGSRKYWRLKEKDNPCDGVVDYVDVHFAAPPRAKSKSPASSTREPPPTKATPASSPAPAPATRG